MLVACAVSGASPKPGADINPVTGDGDDGGGKPAPGDGDQGNSGDGDDSHVVMDAGPGGDGDKTDKDAGDPHPIPDAGHTIVDSGTPEHDAGHPPHDAGQQCVPANCSDSVACTKDACGAGGVCTHTPDNSACGANEECTAQGCKSVAPTCDESPCKVVSPQCGCPDGQGCYPTGTTGGTCETAGTRPIGSNCSGINSCVPGAVCIGNETSAKCRSACAKDAQCTGSGAFCAGELQDSDVLICTIGCDPVAQTGCGTGEQCDIGIQSSNSRPFTDCGPGGGTRKQGQTCSDTSPCAPGFACLTKSGTSSCFQYCTTDDECSGLLYCDLNLTTTLKIGSKTYHFCQP